MKDGLIPFTYQGETFQTYYKVYGDVEDRARIPIVVLHGGPGFIHDYTLPHADLSDHAHGSHAVIFYDQIGNGRSTHLPHKPPSFWTVDLFLDELVSLLEHFGNQDAFHLVGHSWGGMMGAEFVLRRHPPGLRRLVIANSPASIALWRQSFAELLQAFPQDVKDAMERGPDGDREGHYNAILKVYAVHGCRVQPFPEELVKTVASTYGVEADRTVGRARVLEGWTIIDRLHLVNVPTLVINGRYDIAQDYVTAPYSEKIPNSRWVKFEESSHTPCWEEREKYINSVASFLGKT
ncbi:proline-specific peptidase [Daedaleopsis nitida]|nr:proline-specific peptidase [Daedaleopsis nitida]